MKLKIEVAHLLGSALLVFNLLIINILSAQNNSVCPVGVGMEPSSGQSQKSSSVSNEIYSPNFVGWENMKNVKKSDDLKASVVLTPMKRSRQLMINNFKFQVPAGASISGITLSMEGQSNDFLNIDEMEVLLLDADGIPKGENKANEARPQKSWSSGINNSDRTWTYGSETDDWGTQWTANEVNSQNFGIQLQLRNSYLDTIAISIDSVALTVHYTPLYSFCDAKCLTFYIDKYETQGSYVWHYPTGFDMVSSSIKNQTIDLKITSAAFGIYPICVDVFDKNGNLVETCCRNFSYVNCNSSEIKGLAWLDLNDNKLRDSGEGILSNVPLTVYKENGVPLDTILTDDFGNYRFVNLPVDKYYIKSPEIPGHKMILYNPNTNPDLNSDITNAYGQGSTNLIQTELGICVEAIDFGYTPLVSIGDFVWVDKNLNGLQDSMEIGIEAVKVYVINGSNVIVDSTVTNSLGIYKFNNLPANKYCFKFKIPTDYTPTFKNQSNLTKNSKIDVNGKTLLVNYNSAGFRSDIDAGFYQTGRIGDLVWEDKNGNGIQNPGEAPIPNVAVRLRGTAGDGQPVDVSTTADANGKYFFNNIKPGTYTIKFTKPSNFFFTLKGQGSDLTKDNDVDGMGEANITVQSGELKLGVDAGLYRLGSISNYVWEDLNANGVQNIGEQGIFNVTVTLVEVRRDELVQVGSRVTDENGYYIFEGLKPGNYTLQFTAPDGYHFSSSNIGIDDTIDSDPINGKVENLMLMSGEQNDTYDAGLYKYASIGDFVWNDKNGNGVQDTNEPGIPNIEVVLTGSSEVGTISLSTSTVGNGAYLFTNLIPGNYSISVNIPDTYIETTPNQGNDGLDSDGIDGKVTNINLMSGMVNNTIDFGLVAGFSIGDFVWEDINTNGIQDAGEQGISGLTITLNGQFDNGNTINLTTTTDADGKYIFNNIFPGIISMTLGLPSGYSPTKAELGGDRNVDSNLAENGGEVIFIITNIFSDLSIDFGVVKLGSIGDLVWEDVNCNGIKEPSEPGIPGVRVILTGLDLFSTLIDKQTITDANGNYLFGNLLPGDYSVTFDIPVDYEFSAAMVNVVSLTSGENALNIDAPFFRRGKIGNFVWVDENENGLQDDGEKGLSNVKVIIKSLSHAEFDIRDTLTDATGSYLFDRLKPGKYEVSFEVLNGFIVSPKGQGSDYSLDSNVDALGNADEITLVSGESNLTIDAGFISIANASIGDFVWEDTNGNGIQEPGELGIVDVNVKLSGVTSNGVINRETFTDAEGKYNFPSLPAGNYTITFEKPIGYIFTLSNSGSDEGVDSDANRTNGKTETLTLDASTTVSNIDAGMFRFGTIGDFVWNDINKDGLQDTNEPGIADVVLVLKDADGNELATTTSNTDGFYTFNSLVPGLYTIESDVPAGFVLTTNNTTNDALNSDFTLSNGKISTSEIEIKSNQVLQNIDLGFKSFVGSIAGFTWYDANGDGIKGVSESVLDSIVVYLVDNVGDTIATDTTDLLGSYVFSDLIPANYVVRFGKSTYPLFTSALQGTDRSVDSDVVSTATNSTNTITIAEGQDIVGINAGYVNYSSVGDFVWVDLNENGLQDVDELGLNGIKIKLYDASGLVIDSTFSSLKAGTMISGFYTFNNLPFGNYTLSFGLPRNFRYTDYVISDTTKNSDIYGDPNGRTAVFTLLPNQNRADIDAGYVIVAPVTGNILGKVWQDANNNKVRESSELPLANVEVKLYKIDGTLVATQQSTSDGTYAFLDAPFGDYYIQVPVLNDKLFVLYAGQSVPFDSDISNAFGQGTTRLISLFPGETLDNIDLGYADKIAIGDFVWEDVNNNGLQDLDEPGIGNVQVSLINEAGQVEKSVVSAANGSYLINEVPVGNYTLTFQKLNGYVFALINPSDNNANSKPNENGVVSLTNFTTAQTYTNIDAGYVRAGAIGDNVWLDLNGNGFFQTGEPGITGIKVKLYTSTGILKDSTLTTVQPVTNFAGYYNFVNVRPGAYYLTFDIPSNYIISPSGVGDENNDSNITNANGPKTTDVFNVASNQTITNIDAAAYLPATLGDRVWDDTNMNGTQDPGEQGVPGVTVTLFTQSGTTLATKVTDDNGNYAFTGLRQRLYYLQFTIPDGYMFSDQNTSGDGATDSDTDQTGTTPLISLAHGSTFLDIDAGIHVTTANLIMGTVWNDINKDGMRTEDEPLAPLVKVYLKDINDNVLESHTTNHAGMYCFATENSGQHYVFVEAPVDNVFTEKGIGSNPNKDCDVDVDGNSEMIMLDAAYVMKYVDAGYYYKVSSSINGVVWLDRNNNGLRNPSDSLLKDVLVLVFNKFKIFIKSTKTNEDGTYSLKNLDPGQYYCKIPEYDDKSYVMFTGSNTDIDSEITNQYGEGTSRLITIEGGVPFNNFDFGYKNKAQRIIAQNTDVRTLDIYPNPTLWYMDVKIPSKEVANYYILNNMGAIVQKGTITDGSARLDIDRLLGGKYSLHVVNSKVSLSKSFMKVDY